jgi:hypothetical protein
MCQDSIGGDFVENHNYSMVLVESTKKSVLVEITGDPTTLQSGPNGFFKRLEIGVNNYDPMEFLNKSFELYFFQDKQNEEIDQEENLISTMSSEPSVLKMGGGKVL